MSWPSRITETRSHKRSTSSRSCEMKMIETPFSLRRPISSYSRERSNGPSGAVGSSMMMHVVLGLHGAHDLQHLLIGDRQRIGLGMRRDLQAHPLRELAEAPLHAAPVGETASDAAPRRGRRWKEPTSPE